MTRVLANHKRGCGAELAEVVRCFLVARMGERDPGVGGRIILKCVFRKYVGVGRGRDWCGTG